MSAAGVFLAAGTLSVVGGAVRDGAWPDNGTKAVVATSGLVLVSSALSHTPARPVVESLAWLFLLVIIMATVPGLRTAQRKGT
jgi:hypothetical protein